jgi:DNA-binding NtrC family response regulator
MKTKRVHFIDDDPQVRDFFENIFVSTLSQALSLEITVCSSFAEAKAAYEKGPDLIICDYLLGGPENGLDFFRYVASRDRNQPFIIFTGADDALVRPIVNEQEVSENLYLAVGKDWDLLKQMLIAILEDDSSVE